MERDMVIRVEESGRWKLIFCLWGLLQEKLL